MKNLKITLLAFVIILANIANVYAATTANITASVENSEVEIGETITIDLTANCETGIEGIDSTLEYDKTKLELQSLNVDTEFSNMSGTDESTGEYKLTVISNSTETITDATFATIEFKVLDNAQIGEELVVKLSKIEIGDSNDEWTQIDDRNVTLEVIEDLKGEDNNNLGTGDNTPGGNDNLGTGTNNQENNNKPSTENGRQDNTQANKEIDYAGLRDYAFIIILAISVIAFISYIKYKKYRNI